MRVSSNLLIRKEFFWWPGAESKDPPQAAPILILATVQFLRVHAGVHQTDQRLASKFGLEPLTYPTNLPALCRFAKHFDGPRRHCQFKPVSIVKLLVSVFRPPGTRVPQLGLTRKHIQRMNLMSICGDDWLLYPKRPSRTEHTLPAEYQSADGVTAQTMQWSTTMSNRVEQEDAMSST